jgi:hypothetical protein
MAVRSALRGGRPLIAGRFLVLASVTDWLFRTAGRIRSMEKYNGLVANRTGDLPARNTASTNYTSPWRGLPPPNHALLCLQHRWNFLRHRLNVHAVPVRRSGMARKVKKNHYVASSSSPTESVSRVHLASTNRWGCAQSLAAATSKAKLSMWTCTGGPSVGSLDRQRSPAGRMTTFQSSERCQIFPNERRILPNMLRKVTTPYSS